MFEWIIFLPILVPLVGALVLPAVDRVNRRFGPWASFIFILSELVAILVNIAPVQHRIEISNWQIASFAPTLEFDGTALLLLVTMFLVLGALRLVTYTNAVRTSLDPLVLVVLASAIVLTLAANLPAIYLASALLDIAIFLWRIARDIERETAIRSLAMGLGAGLLLFAGAQFAGTPNAETGMLLIGLAFWARLGLFPFHWVYPMRGSDSRDLWVSRAVPMLASSALWLRWPNLQTAAPALWIAILTVAALSASALWIWLEEQPARAAIVGAWHAVALVPLAVAFDAQSGSALALWLILGISFALGLMEAALRWRAENRNHWPKSLWVLAVLAIAGLPLTPVFVGRASLYVAMWDTGNAWFLLLAGVITIAVLAPLWRYVVALAAPEPRDPTRIETLGLAVLLFGFFVLGLAPLPIVQALGPSMADSAQSAIGQSTGSSGAVAMVVSFAVILLALVISLVLRRAAQYYRPPTSSLLARTARFADMEWLERTVTGVGFEMGAAARNFAALAEENPAVWILLVALWVAIFVLIPR